MKLSRLQSCLIIILHSSLFSLFAGFNVQASSYYDASDWPVFSYDSANTNHNPVEHKLTKTTVKYLTRAWETFNDDSLSQELAPTGFVLEDVLQLRFPNAVVGVTASPLISDGTIYYVDQLGTVFARDAKTGGISDVNRHWTTTLVDPDFDSGEPAVLPELIYTSPVLTDTHVWVVGSVYGRLHALNRLTGIEMDFNLATQEIDPYTLITDLPFASVLGDSVVVNTGYEHGNRDLFITGINVILNDVLVQGAESGVQLAIDITDPQNPVEFWRQFSIGINPATNKRFGTGVSVGSGLAVDKVRHLVIGGTGQNTSLPYVGYPDPDLAPAGYIDRGDSVYAIDYLTGEFIWHNQFHHNDIFDLNNPVSTGPNQPDGPKDADVLSPPVLWSIWEHYARRDLAGVGSKGGLYRVVDRDTGNTIWERQISKPTGLGGIQAGSAYANNTVFVAGFEGLDDGFSDAQFGVSIDTGKYPNAFFATFNPAFWADMEDISNDNNPATGTRIKVYALDAATGESKWHRKGNDFVELKGASALRHVSVANALVYVTTTAGELYILNAKTGKQLYRDQTLDLNATMNLGLGKPHHASMNTGVLISDGMVYTGYGAQNNPSGGMIAYKIDKKPATTELLRKLNHRIKRMPSASSLKHALFSLVKSARKDVKHEDYEQANEKLQAFIQAVIYANGLNYHKKQELLGKAYELLELFEDAWKNQ